MTIATAAAAAAERVAGPRAAAETGGAWLVIACDADGLPVLFCPGCSTAVFVMHAPPLQICAQRDPSGDTAGSRQGLWQRRKR